jgi:uncharacterized repeat protein (TIGR03803 family)
MTMAIGWKLACVFLLCAATVVAASAQTFNTLAAFDGTNGKGSQATLVQGTDGLLYGTTAYGGRSNAGTVFRITRNGDLETLHSFSGYDGANPMAGLTVGMDGNLYGTTYAGGAIASYGTIFEVSSAGLTVVHNFDGSDGAYPQAPLVLGADGNLYGETEYFGGHQADGTVFKLTPSGTLTTVYTFDGLKDGAFPTGGLIQADDGYFYGTTRGGGFPDFEGVVFELKPGGGGGILYTFCHKRPCPDGAQPSTGVIQASDGNFYGTTPLGGLHGGDGIYEGTVFKLTPDGALTTLHNFVPRAGAGLSPQSGLVQASDGNLYGTTGETIFSITTTGTLTTLYRFCVENECPNGSAPMASLLQATDGSFYGTTSAGGTNNYGTVFRLSMRLDPFVSFIRNSGRVGQQAGVLGQGLTGTTSVSFNGVSAAYTVVSDTYLTATIPSGATAGSVTVTTPTGTLTSTVQFHVLP